MASEAVSERTRLPCRGAPSWSWGSVDGGIYFVDDQPWQTNLGQLEILSLKEFTLPSLAATVSMRDLTVRGLFISVLMVTANHPLETSKPHLSATALGDFGTDRVQGSTTLIRPTNGRVYEVICDEYREIELRESDLDYRCWIHPNALEAQLGNNTYPHGWCERCKVDEETLASSRFGFLLIKDGVQEVTAAWLIQFLVLQRSSKVPGSWERVGIGGMTFKAESSPFDGVKLQELRLV